MIVLSTSTVLAQLTPALNSIRMVTISSENPEESARRYSDRLGYLPFEQGTVSTGLARLWDAPAVAGRPYVVLQSPDPAPSYLRFVQVRRAQDYRPMTTSGWNAAELLVRSPYDIHAKLADTAFTHLGGPAALSADSTIHATQYLGPDQEVIYLTADLGARSTSTLASTSSDVGRLFIVVLAGANIDTMARFYRTLFGLEEAFRLSTPMDLVAQAQGRPLDAHYELALLRLAHFSHSIELDAYASAPARVTLAGELPPGIALVSFCIDKFTPALKRVLRAPPALMPGNAYAGAAVSVLRGPADELIELIACGKTRNADS